MEKLLDATTSNINDQMALWSKTIERGIDGKIEDLEKELSIFRGKIFEMYLEQIKSVDRDILTRNFKEYFASINKALEPNETENWHGVGRALFGQNSNSKQPRPIKKGEPVFSVDGTPLMVKTDINEGFTLLQSETDTQVAKESDET